MNKKGFTLIELLAVIVVLAVLILIATTAVIPQMNKARKQAFITEATTFVNAAKEYFLYQEVQGNNVTCVTVADLKGDYIEAKGKQDYRGKITISGSGSTLDYTIDLNNGTYKLRQTATQLATAGESVVEDGDTTTTYSCTSS